MASRSPSPRPTPDGFGGAAPGTRPTTDHRAPSRPARSPRRSHIGDRPSALLFWLSAGLAISLADWAGLHQTPMCEPTNCRPDRGAQSVAVGSALGVPRRVPPSLPRETTASLRPLVDRSPSPGSVSRTVPPGARSRDTHPLARPTRSSTPARRQRQVLQGASAPAAAVVAGATGMVVGAADVAGELVRARPRRRADVGDGGAGSSSADRSAHHSPPPTSATSSNASTPTDGQHQRGTVSSAYQSPGSR